LPANVVLHGCPVAQEGPAVPRVKVTLAETVCVDQPHKRASTLAVDNPDPIKPSHAPAHDAPGPSLPTLQDPKF
jgi:hypothetical protein